MEKASSFDNNLNATNTADDDFTFLENKVNEVIFHHVTHHEPIKIDGAFPSLKEGIFGTLSLILIFFSMFFNNVAQNQKKDLDSKNELDKDEENELDYEQLSNEFLFIGLVFLFSLAVIHISSCILNFKHKEKSVNIYKSANKNSQIEATVSQNIKSSEYSRL